jgi:hypothetical protein
MPSAESQQLRDAIVDPEASPEDLVEAFGAVARHAREMAPGHRREVLERCLAFTSPVVDPYAPASGYQEARWAAAALLVADPALDKVVLEALRSRPQDREGLLLAFAGALVQRDRAWRPFARAVEAAELGREDALRFAASCDRRSTTLTTVDPALSMPRRVASSCRRWLRGVPRSGAWSAPAFGVAVAVASGVVAVAVAVRTACLPQGYAVGPGDALAALSLLVAAAVFAAELAADRLQGVIARRVALSPPLAAGLTFEVLLLASAIWRVSSRNADNRAFLQVLLIGGLSISLMIALFSLLRRTDDLRAIEIYSRRRRRLFKDAGERISTFQTAARKTADEVAGFGWVRLSSSRAHSEQRAPIRASRRGFVVVDVEALAEMDRIETWHSQRVRLRVTVPLGQIVGEGDEIAGVVPDVGATVTAEHVAAAQRAVRTVPVGPVAEASEGVGALVGSAVRLASVGNTEAADRVNDRLLGLVATSLRAAGPAPDDQRPVTPVPISPLALVIVDRALAAIRGTQDSAVHATMTDLLQGIAAVGSDMPRVVIGRFLHAYGADEAPGLHVNVLWEACCRAIDADDSTAMTLAYERLEQLGDRGRALELLGWLAAYQVWVRPERSADALARVRAGTDADSMQQLVLHRLGAAALLAGHLSLGAEIAYGFVGRAAALRGYAERDAAAAFENLRSELFGLLLGDDPQWALLEFADLVADLES